MNREIPIRSYLWKKGGRTYRAGDGAGLGGDFAPVFVRNFAPVFVRNLSLPGQSNCIIITKWTAPGCENGMPRCFRMPAFYAVLQEKEGSAIHEKNRDFDQWGRLSEPQRDDARSGESFI